MAAGRTLRSLVSRRRRADEEGEDEEGPVFVDDSQSEGSALTEPDDEDDADVDASSLGRPGDVQAGSAGPYPAEAEAATNGTGAKKARKSRKKAERKGGAAADATKSHSQSEFKAMADTEVMMNGLTVSQQRGADGPVADFETMDLNGAGTTARTNGDAMPTAERQRREHEEYRKKRDSNPAFIPNRGNFFMHDTRGQANGPAPPQRNAWQDRGRGRGPASSGGALTQVNLSWADKASEQPWKHDLHDTINEEPAASGAPAPAPPIRSLPPQNNFNHLFPTAAPQGNNVQHRSLSFDSTTLLGTVQVRVSLPGMKSPKSFAEVPVRRYVRLPNHRPPMRRDKPVRILIPGDRQRQAFPHPTRSFIFIPRQMRPSQQGFHRGYQRGVGGYGYSSRRTSMHGSMYSGSVAPSRRSSLAGVSRDRAFSPAGSFVGMPPSRPIVRLPHGSQPLSAASTPIGPLSGHHTPTGPHQVHTYPLPQLPLQMGTPTTAVQQPQPQKKSLDITLLESQPFHSQLPAHINEPPQYQQPLPPPPQPYFSPGPQYQYPPSHPQAGTPLSGIPEQAIHAAAFQPPPYGQSPYYPPYPAQQGFVYSPPTSGSYPPMPMYMMPPPQGYMLPPPVPTLETPMSQPLTSPNRPPSSAGDGQNPQSSQSGMVAHESNGMVFYVPASEAQSSEQYQPAESFVPAYAMPGLPPPTPAPDNQMQYYYPPMPHSGMQEVGTGVYYPAQQ